MRVRGALVLALVVSGCGGSSSPAAPTPTPAPSVIDLAPGLYTLTLTMSQFGEPVCDRGLCVTFGACISSGDPPARLVTTAVRVERAGDLVTIRPEDPTATFRIDLRIIGG